MDKEGRSPGAEARRGRDRTEVNRRFTVKADNAEPAWRKVAVAIDLDRIISLRYDATVRNDNTVRFDGILIDIPPGPGGRNYAQAHVEVRQLLNGRWRVYLRDQCIATATPTPLGQLRPRKARKRSQASKAFRAQTESSHGGQRRRSAVGGRSQYC